MAKQDFVQGLTGMGYQVEERGDDCVSFAYPIQTGTLANKTIQLGFVVPGDFPLSPPSGPHVSPSIHPLHPDQSPGHPTGGVHSAQNPHFEGDWQYWSRPYPDWPGSNRSVQAYMAHIHRLFETQ